ncbi:hypothetical protein [Burkholderia gladioli]|uniref:hypothetical protein n=1 Tax=Burkholderia gladioli TaxID=28095 RepID=UPI001CC69B1C|nr:hypothetical protein [Burkholderia gladioli]
MDCYDHAAIGNDRFKIPSNKQYSTCPTEIPLMKIQHGEDMGKKLKVMQARREAILAAVRQQPGVTTSPASANVPTYPQTQRPSPRPIPPSIPSPAPSPTTAAWS